MHVVESSDTWHGRPVKQFDFYIVTPPDTSPDIGDVRILLRLDQAKQPVIKWVCATQKRQGLARQAYAWLASHFNAKLRATQVLSTESKAFHQAMVEAGIVARFSAR